MDDVVPAAPRQQVAENAEAEPNRGPDSTSPALRVEAESGTDRDHLDSREAGVVTLPLAQREVRDVVARVGESLGEVAVPALRATGRVRIEAVVDDADAHGEAREEYVGGRLGLA